MDIQSFNLLIIKVTQFKDNDRSPYTNKNGHYKKERNQKTKAEVLARIWRRGFASTQREGA